ncbi:hypothetical protein [Pseudotamlana carrageenivorans]|uniref:Uncharacterized protein n=1 Tax=Pseudotamlana carrageenivorans TaxID=2069432 RepID=A0A2I7SF40_9FLAO|nr:hypothetical protein [Tamlana carrageenivorans]AUS04508.1 hypothetical protein C1A40_03025 [Tamlana carrageenivorans]
MRKLLLIFGLLAFFSCTSSEPNEANAKNAARSAIIQKVKNPTDLKFHHNEVISNLGYNTFQYQETINATNGFGGSIKKNAVVKVKWIKGDASEVSSWIIEDIYIY